MAHDPGPLLTRATGDALLAARDAGAPEWTGSLDLGRTDTTVQLHADGWEWRQQHHPYPSGLKDRTIYHRDGDGFVPVARYSGALIKLVPTAWGPPTFEILQRE